MPANVDVNVCLGCGSCAAACPTESITIGEDGKAKVNADSCVDCGACVGSCPAGAISQ